MITGMRSCSGAIASFAAVVMMVAERISSGPSRCQTDHSPAKAKG
jgi:hypothetical protein